MSDFSLSRVLWPAESLLAVFLCAAMLAPAAASAEAPPTQLQPMTVTGSQLATRPDSGAYPVTTLDRQTLLKAGHTTLGGFLQSLPLMAGAPIGTSVGQRGSGGGFSRGIESVELRGLGPERTLVLLNGRRIVAGGTGLGGVVDLAVMPLALVERIEILKTGASVSHGADAVAGVVNVITRRQLSATQLQANSSLTDRGDGWTRSLTAVTGHSGSRQRLMFGAEYFEQDAVGKGERAFSRNLLAVDGPDNRIVAGGSSAPPAGNFRSSAGRLTLADGEDGRDAEDFRPFISSGPDNDRYNFNPDEDLLQDSRRSSIFALASFDLTPDLELFAEALMQQRDADTQLAPLPLFTNRLDGVVVAADNVFNPFDEEIADARRRLVAGARGAWRSWDWTAALNHGRNRLRQTQRGDVRRDRLALALGPSYLEGGQAVCGTAQAPIADCVPLNLFGGAGSIDRQMLDFAGIEPLRDRFANRQTTANLDLAGDLAELPWASLRAAVGYQYRREEARDLPDPLTRSGNTTGAARAASQGRFQTHEVYAQFGLPLLAREAAQQLDLELGLRALDSSNFRPRLIFDAGLQYRQSAGLTLRLAHGQAYRAPSVGELFGGVNQSNPAIADPCANFQNLSALQVQRCIDQGVPADGSFDQTGNETPQLEGGNPQLEPETATSTTLGLSFTPQAWPDLVLHLDYYALDIDDGIAALGANTLLAQCLATGNPRFCGRIERNAQGEILRVQSQLQNIARETARGLDLELAVSHAGLRHRLLLSRVLERELRAFPGAAPLLGAGSFDADNFGAIPRWKALYTLNWQIGPNEFKYGLQWIGPLRERGGELFPGTSRRIGSVVYHDLRWQRDLAPGLSLSLAAENLADKQPPLLINADAANTDVSTYRVLGRRYRLQFALEF